MCYIRKYVATNRGGPNGCVELQDVIIQIFRHVVECKVVEYKSSCSRRATFRSACRRNPPGPEGTEVRGGTEVPSGPFKVVACGTDGPMLSHADAELVRVLAARREGSRRVRPNLTNSR